MMITQRLPDFEIGTFTEITEMMNNQEQQDKEQENEEIEDIEEIMKDISRQNSIQEEENQRKMNKRDRTQR